MQSTTRDLEPSPGIDEINVRYLGGLSADWNPPNCCRKSTNRSLILLLVASSNLLLLEGPSWDDGEAVNPLLRPPSDSQKVQPGEVDADLALPSVLTIVCDPPLPQP